jgi:ribonuclease BN (tRNA processing enzyme)
MHIEFLGTAGYHPCEDRHTTCIYLPDAAPQSGFVLDAGGGLFRLVKRELPSQLHIFMSHAHLDHSVGLTYLLDVLHGKNCTATIYGNAPTLAAITQTLFTAPLFPVEFRFATHTVEPGVPFAVDGVHIETFALTHPGGSLGYRFTWPQDNTNAISSTQSSGAKSLAYVTDTVGDGLYLDHIRNLDVLIHERNFADKLQKVATLTGHCSSSDVAKVAREAQPQQLLLMHFNPMVDGDPALEDNLAQEFPHAVFSHDKQIIEF